MTPPVAKGVVSQSGTPRGVVSKKVICQGVVFGLGPDGVWCLFLHFVNNNVPAIFYFNGTHEDYHRPTDTADKIRYDLLEKRARLIFYTAWELANRSRKINLNK